MTCRTWWIIASVNFLVGMILGAFSYFVGNATANMILALLNVGFVIAGWVLWAIGLVSYIRWR